MKVFYEREYLTLETEVVTAVEGVTIDGEPLVDRETVTEEVFAVLIFDAATASVVADDVAYSKSHARHIAAALLEELVEDFGAVEATLAEVSAMWRGCGEGHAFGAPAIPQFQGVRRYEERMAA